MDTQTYERLGIIFDEIYAQEQTHAQYVQFEAVLQAEGYTVDEWFTVIEERLNG